MDRGQFIKQLIFWHDNDEHQHIIDAIENTPRNTWDFEISGLYARALNNLERYEDAMDQLMMFRDEGWENGVWNFRVGYSLHFLNRELEAIEHFERAMKFGDNGEDTRYMLKRSVLEATIKAFLADAVKLLEAGERDIKKIQEKFDKLLTTINNNRIIYFKNDADMKESVKNTIDERVLNIIEHFNLNIDVETLTRKLDV